MSNYFNWKILLCIGCYIISHCIRTLRLYIISGDVNASLKALFVEQFKTNGVNLIMPFKLGEAYRFLRFKKVFNSGFTSLNTIIIERFFDFFILASLFSLGLFLYPNEILEIQNTLVSIMLVLVLILVVLLAMQDAVLMLHKRLLYRFQSRYSFKLLKFSYEFLRNSKEAKNILRTKSLSILSFSILIWSFELLSLFLFFNELDYRIDLIILLTVFIAFSSLLPNGPLGFGGVQLSFYSIFLLFNKFDDYLVASTAYTIYIFGSGIIISLIIFIRNSVIKSK
tara:strand:- start:920 stop:1765 length:846 start_codon:yes stop_codon:yes gene_type:complete